MTFSRTCGPQAREKSGPVSRRGHYRVDPHAGLLARFKTKVRHNSNLAHAADGGGGRGNGDPPGVTSMAVHMVVAHIDSWDNAICKHCT